jgi:hypothetical protein
METAKVGMQHTDNPDAGDYHNAVRLVSMFMHLCVK